MRLAWFSLIGVFAVFSLGCAESVFQLVPDSRLPRWFSLPSNARREEFEVEMSYYIGWIREGRSAQVVIRRRSNGEEVARGSGPKVGMEPHTLGQALDHLEGAQRCPCYEIITINGVTEVVEHRRIEPIFYLVDDDEIKRKLGVGP